jgi:zinc protease
MARRPTPSSWRGLEVDLPVAERTLANGLKALVLPRRHTPIVVCDLYYPVGSFDEPPGLTGLAHFVEHMLFKGTDRFPKGEIDRLVLVAAGQSNAETGEDSTH